MSSAISGPVSSPPKRSAISSRSRSPSSLQGHSELGRKPDPVVLDDQLGVREMVLDRLLRRRSVPAVVVDQQVPGDRDQPGARAGAIGIEALPGAESALEGLLGEVLGVGARTHAVAEEAVDAVHVRLVQLGDLQTVGAPRPACAASRVRSALPAAVAVA